MIGLKSRGRYAKRPRSLSVTFRARAREAVFWAKLRGYWRGKRDIDSTPPTSTTRARPDWIFSTPCVTASKPDAQLRATV